MYRTARATAVIAGALERLSALSSPGAGAQQNPAVVADQARGAVLFSCCDPADAVCGGTRFILPAHVLYALEATGPAAAFLEREDGF
ncbi:uncharacterized protein THITE_157813 [Thermothielavioides terrestris NRRL 8126]|uniref:Uncharacterized protein n=1 Tax=Thermothielavioides terrestris (strain ATCC 38088 / NRRL 8126) TaxID=578455 RepID=G2QWC4_THETT|nr:uncharacterized protein THITE_157813 [Thermothielavioides terrestris NRRL 8126]AEO63899.1 hypothetical protein THITE_157813 [Thermothielavioides terrestris NRRL 8126]